MELSEILKEAGAHKRRRRRGRGNGSGMGKTSGRGTKGAGSRAGASGTTLAEGGQMPIIRRLPKRGFNNAQFATRFSVVNIGDLNERFEAGAHVTPESFLEAGLIRNLRHKVKVLGNGELSKKLTVEAAKFSAKAAEKIQAVGGQVIES